MRFEGTETYIATEDLRIAVNAAIVLERPLLWDRLSCEFDISGMKKAPDQAPSFEYRFPRPLFIHAKRLVFDMHTYFPARSYECPHFFRLLHIGFDFGNRTVVMCILAAHTFDVRRAVFHPAGR